MRLITLKLLIVISISLSVIQCEKSGIGLISVDQEKELGRQLDSLIMNTPENYTILGTASNPEAYDFIEGIIDEILASGYLIRNGLFTYRIRIINEDVLNAFALPGGYIYFYTGLLNYLDNSAQFEMLTSDDTHRQFALPRTAQPGGQAQRF